MFPYGIGTETAMQVTYISDFNVYSFQHRKSITKKDHC